MPLITQNCTRCLGALNAGAASSISAPSPSCLELERVACFLEHVHARYSRQQCRAIRLDNISTSSHTGNNIRRHLFINGNIRRALASNRSVDTQMAGTPPSPKLGVKKILVDTVNNVANPTLCQQPVNSVCPMVCCIHSLYNVPTRTFLPSH